MPYSYLLMSNFAFGAIQAPKFTFIFLVVLFRMRGVSYKQEGLFLEDM